MTGRQRISQVFYQYIPVACVASVMGDVPVMYVMVYVIYRATPSGHGEYTYHYF